MWLVFSFLPILIQSITSVIDTPPLDTSVFRGMSADELGFEFLENDDVEIELNVDAPTTSVSEDTTQIAAVEPISEVAETEPKQDVENEEEENQAEEEERPETSEKDHKSSAYNTKSNNTISSVAQKAIDNSPVIIGCEEEGAKCDDNETPEFQPLPDPTPTHTPKPSPEPTPEPTIVPMPPISPVPGIVLPIEPPKDPCEPIPLMVADGVQKINCLD